MPRPRIDLGKYHPPWDTRRPAPEPAVDEVTEPSRGKAQRAQRCDEIGDLEPALVPPASKEGERDQHAEKPAVKAHSALPEREHLEGVPEVVKRFVEQNVAEPAAENDAKNTEEKHVVDVARMPAGEQILPCANLAQDDEEREADKVHQPVPAHGQRPDVERNRIELRVDQHR